MLGWGIGEWTCPNGDVRRSVQHVQRVKHGDDDNDTLDALLILTSIIVGFYSDKEACCCDWGIY